MGMTKQAIRKNDNIMEVLQKYPETAEVFAQFDFHCIGCMAASFEDIEQGCQAHGIDADALVGALNAKVSERENVAAAAKAVGEGGKAGGD